MCGHMLDDLQFKSVVSHLKDGRLRCGHVG